MAKKKKEQESVSTGEWLNTYADMVTLLLAFFVLLLASATTDSAKLQAIANYFNPSISILNSGETVGDGEMIGGGISQMPDFNQALEETMDKTEKEDLDELKKMASDFKTYFEENNLSNRIDVSVEDNYVKIKFTDNVLFDKSKAVLKPEAVEILNKLSDQLLKYPNTDIKIEGHTDSDAINTIQFPSNWELSAARAISVAKYYIGEKNFSPERLSAEGFGEYKPIASNDTIEGKSQNRRVEIKIVKKDSSK